MAGRDFSGDDVIHVLVNVGSFWVDRVNGSHYVLKWEHPDGVEKRTVSGPRHDRISVGTLRGIAEDAGANDFEAFCKWIDRYRQTVSPYCAARRPRTNTSRAIRTAPSTVSMVVSA